MSAASLTSASKEREPTGARVARSFCSMGWREVDAGVHLTPAHARYFLLLSSSSFASPISDSRFL